MSSGKQRPGVSRTVLVAALGSALFAVLAVAFVVGSWLRAVPAPAASVAQPPAVETAAAVRSPQPVPANSQAAAGVSPPVASAAPGFDEGELMRLLRSARGNDPALVIELAREGNRRFPNSADAPERTSILIHALAEQGLSSEARGEAEQMVNHYPDSAWVREIESFTGAHRHRNIRVDEQGRLRYYDPPPS